MGTLVVSLRSKGLASFSKQAVLNWRAQALAFALEAFDVFVSFPLTLFLLSWTSWLSIFIAILSVAISVSPEAWLMNRFNSVNVVGSVVVTDGSMSLALFIVFIGMAFIPAFMLLALVLWRREQAMAHVAKLKALVVGLVLSANSAIEEDVGNIVQKQALVLLDDLHR